MDRSRENSPFAEDIARTLPCRFKRSYAQSTKLVCRLTGFSCLEIQHAATSSAQVEAGKHSRTGDRIVGSPRHLTGRTADCFEKVPPYYKNVHFSAIRNCRMPVMFGDPCRGSRRRWRTRSCGECDRRERLRRSFRKMPGTTTNTALTIATGRSRRSRCLARRVRIDPVPSVSIGLSAMPMTTRATGALRLSPSSIWLLCRSDTECSWPRSFVEATLPGIVRPHIAVRRSRGTGLRPLVAIRERRSGRCNSKEVETRVSLHFFLDFHPEQPYI